MTPAALKQLLDDLIATWENEVVEFKSTHTDKIGPYVSALANEANLRNAEKAWLVFGVSDKTRRVTGTDYRIEHTQMAVAQGTEPNITFRNIYELLLPEGRVVLFEVPAAPRGMPIAWHGHYYARAGESLTALSIDKQDEIRQQTRATDWSAQIVMDATVADLDEIAIHNARESFVRKHANRFTAEEIASWSLLTFLDRAKVTQNGQITRTALLLLGKSESAYKLSPHPAQMTWKLDGEAQAYEHFRTPFFLTTTQLYQRIRNIQIRLLPANQLIPYEVAKYDQKIVLEALHNCIAHQDYMRNGRINVIEQPEKLIFENEGYFYEGQPNDYVLGNKMPRRYRNPFLVQAMVELGMIDTMGYGIHRMNMGQAKRYFPLPDYDLSEENAVRMVIYGGVVDPAYSQMLMQKTDLAFVDVLALDRVQKKLSIHDEAISRLRRANLIEGRRPNFHVSATIAAVTDNKAEYVKMRSLDDKHYKELILDCLMKFGQASRKEIDNFIVPKLGDALTAKQKSQKISYLLTNMRRAGLIYNAGSDKKPIWKNAMQNAEKKERLQRKNKK